LLVESRNIAPRHRLKQRSGTRSACPGAPLGLRDRGARGQDSTKRRFVRRPNFGRSV
jgi:hypothetical protein